MKNAFVAGAPAEGLTNTWRWNKSRRHPIWGKILLVIRSESGDYSLFGMRFSPVKKPANKRRENPAEQTRSSRYPLGEKSPFNSPLHIYSVRYAMLTSIFLSERPSPRWRYYFGNDSKNRSRVGEVKKEEEMNAEETEGNWVRQRETYQLFRT